MFTYVSSPEFSGLPFWFMFHSYVLFVHISPSCVIIISSLCYYSFFHSAFPVSSHLHSCLSYDVCFHNLPSCLVCLFPCCSTNLNPNQMVNGLHLYSAFIPSAVQFMPLIHPFTHTFTHQWRLAAMQGTNQLIRSN